MTEFSSNEGQALGQLVLEALESLEDDALLIVDAQGSPRFSNPAALALFGQGGPKDAIWETGESPIAASLAGRSLRDIPFLLRSGDHPQGLPLLTTNVPLRGGGSLLAFRKRPSSVRALQEAEGRLRAILDNIQDRAWLKDKEGRFLDVNQFHCAIRGVPRHEWIGKTDYDVFPKDLADRFRADDAEVMRSRQQCTFEENLVDIDGQERWLETIKTPVFGEQGEVIGTTGTARDITLRKEAERILRQSNEQLEQRVAERTRELAKAHENLMRKERLAVLGQLAGGVAHQIRNPLAAIMNTVSLLGHHLARDSHPDVHEALSIIREEIRHADVIIAGLLDFARIRAPHRNPTALTDLVERTLLAEEIPNSIEVHRRFDDRPVIPIDTDLIQSALSNLIRNAVEAMPKGGVLELGVSSTAEHATISVRDTGPGIPPDRRPLLFEPLHSTKPTGLGLGLLTARTFVEAHGGRLHSVEVPEGAYFELHLPVRVES